MRLILTIVLAILTLGLQGQDAKELTESGKKLAASGNHEEATKLYSQAIAADEMHLDAYLQRAFSYSVLKQYEMAVNDYSKIIELKPGLVFAYISRGSAYNKLNEFKKALIDFDVAVSIDPENQEAYNNRGWSKKGLGDDDGACADWKKSKKMGNSEAKIIMKNNNC